MLVLLLLLLVMSELHYRYLNRHLERLTIKGRLHSRQSQTDRQAKRQTDYDRKLTMYQTDMTQVDNWPHCNVICTCIALLRTYFWSVDGGSRQFGLI